MGCWNGTDIATSLPIHHGEEIYFILMANIYDIEGGMWTYSVSSWAPVGLPIKGKYDDYGMIEDIVDMHPMWAKVIEEMLDTEDTIYCNEHFRKRVKPGVEGYLRSVERGHRVYPKGLDTNGMNRETIAMGFTMVNATVYETMAEKWHDMDCLPYPRTLPTAEDVVDVIMPDPDDHLSMFKILDEVWPFRMNEGGWCQNPMKWIRSLSHNDIREKLYGVNRMPKEDAVRLVEESMRFKSFLNFLDEVRKPFAPQCGGC
jgi:hypothetical protein